MDVSENIREELLDIPTLGMDGIRNLEHLELFGHVQSWNCVAKPTVGAISCDAEHAYL